MKNLTNVLDDLVARLKKLDELSGVKFIHAGKGDFAPKPLDEFLIACSSGQEVLSREREKGEEYKGTLEFTLYAPQGEGKRALTLLSQRLMMGLETVDTDCILEKITIADSAYDRDMSAWRQRVSAQVHKSEQLEAEVASESIFLGTTKISGVTAFEVSAECSSYERRELLSGYVEEYVGSVLRYTIVMSVYGADLSFSSLANRNLNIYRESTNMTYDDCRLQKMVNKENGRQDLTLLCRRAHAGAEVTG